MSYSFYASSLRLIPFEKTLFTSDHSPAKTLILRPLNSPEILLFRRSTITFKKKSTTIVPLLSSSSSPSSSVDFPPNEELPPKLQEIIKLFQSVEESKAKLEQLIFYGKNLKPLDSQFRTRENKVEGCESRVWVRAFFDEERNVVFEADSDSVFTKGLAALLVQGLSGSPVPEILKITPEFATLLGLQQSMSPSRNNGFLNMFNLMQKKALHLEVKTENDSISGEILESNDEASVQEADSDSKPSLVEELVTEKIEDSENESKIVALGRRGMMIREKLEKELNPVELEVEDVSYQHTGHAGVRGNGDDDGETHFSLRIVSDCFQGKSLVKRHRLINDLLQEELKNGLHAISIVAKTPNEVLKA